MIKSINFFDELNEEQIEKLIDISHISHYSKETILYYESEVNNNLLFLIKGLIKVYKVDKFDNEIFLYHIYEKSLISEISSIDENEIYCFSNTEFVEDSMILSIDFKLFYEHFLSKNILTTKLIKEILKKTHQLQCLLNRELVFDATAKVAFMLNNDLEMFNKLKRQEISFMLHIQPETLSRVLKRLKRSEIIDIENNNIIVLNKEKLCSIFKGTAV